MVPIEYQYFTGHSIICLEKVLKMLGFLEAKVMRYKIYIVLCNSLTTDVCLYAASTAISLCLTTKSARKESAFGADCQLI